MGTWVISFVGLALIYAALASGLIMGLMRLWGRGSVRHLLPLVFLILFFVFLTQHPFPAPGTLSCPVPSATPQLTPFRFMQSIWLLQSQDATVWAYLANRTFVATVMNFLLCAAIGSTLPRSMRSLSAALPFGFGLSLAAETTQLTGLWGLYPCAYRQFNVDDLILNTLGVLAGTMLARSRCQKTDVV